MATKAKKKSRSKSSGPKKSQYDSLHDLFILKLRSLYDIEQEITKALPKMAKAATNPELRDAFTMHLEETRNQAARLERAFEILGVPAKKEKVEAIRGLAKDTEWCIKNVKNREARDAVLVASAQFVEHYEIAGYGTALAWSELMGHTEVTDLLQETLDEESATDEKLSGLAETKINTEVPSGMSGQRENE